jgi:hypothetical protein
MERGRKETTEMTKEKVYTIDVIICKGNWYQARLAMVVDTLSKVTELTRQGHYSEPPFLPGGEQINGDGGIDEPINHQQHLDGLLSQGDQSQPKTPERKRKAKSRKRSVR